MVARWIVRLEDLSVGDKEVVHLAPIQHLQRGHQSKPLSLLFSVADRVIAPLYQSTHEATNRGMRLLDSPS